MRNSSAVFIYIDIAKALEDGIRFYRSHNNVVLTDGIDGMLSPKYYLKVVDNMGNLLD